MNNFSRSKPMKELPWRSEEMHATNQDQRNIRIADSDLAYVYRSTSSNEPDWYRVFTKDINTPNSLPENLDWWEFRSSWDDYESVYETRSEFEAMNRFFTISGLTML